MPNELRGRNPPLTPSLHLNRLRHQPRPSLRLSSPSPLPIMQEDLDIYNSTALPLPLHHLFTTDERVIINELTYSQLLSSTTGSSPLCFLHFSVSKARSRCKIFPWICSDSFSFLFFFRLVSIYIISSSVKVGVISVTHLTYAF